MAVKNWIVSNEEKIVYISPDGQTYNLHDPYKKSVINMSGWGLPSADIADSRGPFQHGTNPLSIRIPPRTVLVDIYHVGCHRDEYWSIRTGLINALRLNRTNVNNPSPGKLRWYRADGAIRQADVFIKKGPDFPQSTRGWDEFNTRDTLEFIAHNPILYNPNQVTESFGDLGCTILQTLQFPFSFSSENIIFGGTTCNAINNLDINYLGNWQEFPLIRVAGPANNFSITHSQTTLKIALSGYSIPGGDSVTFDLRYGRKTVVLNSTGASLLGYISSDSNLGSFAIEPDPVVEDGVNTFSVSIDDGTVDTQVVFQYYDRYIGI